MASKNDTRVLPVNLDKDERMISLAAGLFMVVYGLVRLPLSAVMALMAGAYFIYRAVKGYCYIYDQLGIGRLTETAVPHQRQTANRQYTDEVDTALNQTFPTSDPPSWMMGR